MGRQARNRRERGARRIVNGIPSSAHPAVVAVLKGATRETAKAWCTGTLVGCDKVLTAAHCVANDPSPSSYQIFFQELGFFAVKSVEWPKEDYKFPYFDLAMLTLEKPVEGIAPIPINWSTRPLDNSVATIVGFGRTGGARHDYGIKREGSVRTAACAGPYAKIPLLCWKFDADVISTASAQNTCNADSGGGVFMRDDDGDRVVEKVFGVVSGGIDAECMKKDMSFNVDVSRFKSWIEKAGEGRLSPAMCGAPLWTRRVDQPKRATITIGPGQDETTFEIDVPEQAKDMRVSINAEDNGAGSNAFTLALDNGEAGGAAEDCLGSPQFASCAVSRPRSGPWRIRIKRQKGQGQLQVTAIIRK
ncbi:trypsin-like serine protease [Hyphomicrobium sp.]|uniref:S1 family peptidase n=1 Tax=Hyphomicrobium sp. TaxID=82 RepID=UPI0025C29B3B|nr:trypsin-like serine protease [Hyphomicrobium sp.]MCC7253051.1 trypsin-like serine protease [Hyphomicrobium sp.]